MYYLVTCLPLPKISILIVREIIKLYMYRSPTPPLLIPLYGSMVPDFGIRLTLKLLLLGHY